MERLLKIKPIKITSKYGKRTHPITGVTSFHNGIDVSAPEDTPVYAPFDGIISDSYTHATGGITCIFDGDNGIQLRMAHLTSTNLKYARINNGEIICHTGNTGASTAPHLHLGVKENNQYVDPLTIFKG